MRLRVARRPDGSTSRARPGSVDFAARRGDAHRDLRQVPPGARSPPSWPPPGCACPSGGPTTAATSRRRCRPAEARAGQDAGSPSRPTYDRARSREHRRGPVPDRRPSRRRRHGCPAVPLPASLRPAPRTAAAAPGAGLRLCGGGRGVVAPRPGPHPRGDRIWSTIPERPRADRPAGLRAGDWDVVATEVFTSTAGSRSASCPGPGRPLVLLRLAGSGIIRLRVVWGAPHPAPGPSGLAEPDPVGTRRAGTPT